MITKIVVPPPHSDPADILKPVSPRTASFNWLKWNAVAKRLDNAALPQKYMTVRLVQMESDTILMAHIADWQRMLVGRSDPEINENPDIDLMGYGGREKGVSRVHATLHRLGHTLSIVDLASANGTYRNGVRLCSNQPHFLLDGDELSFGKMRFHIHFGY